MFQLIIDLSSNIGRIGIAKYDDNTCSIIAQHIWENERSHAEFLVHHIHDCLKTASLEYKDISKIGIVNGPGSFTGIRIAISLAKALALTLKVPCCLINNLQLWGMAASLHLSKSFSHEMNDTSHQIVIAQDVRRNELAIQLFSLTGKPIGEMQHTDIANTQLPIGRLYIAGSGVQVVISHHHANDFEVLNISDSHLLIALAHLTKITSPSSEITPLYIRPSDAILPKAMLTFSNA